MTAGQRAKAGAAVAERRRRVASLYLRKVDQQVIAAQLGVNQSTVSRDLTALRRAWREAAGQDTAVLVAREAAELDQMEADCARAFLTDGKAEWVSRRLAIKERRAALLGLDAPKRSEVALDATVDVRAEVQHAHAVLLAALDPFPEARIAAAAALLALATPVDTNLPLAAPAQNDAALGATQIWHINGNGNRNGHADGRG